MTESRYNRQELVSFVGKAGQEKINAARVAVVGVGALGCVISDQLVRAGIGYIRLIDSDTPEISNIQRQILIDEVNVKAGTPKVEAATEKLRRTNSEVEIEPHKVRMGPDNAEKLLSGVDLVFDGTDNFEARYLINRTLLKLGTPWIFGGVLAATGMSFPVLPGGPCLECVLGEEPPTDAVPTTAEQGVLAPIVATIGSIEVIRGLRFLMGKDLKPQLFTVDLERESTRTVPIEKNPSCPACSDN